MNRCYYITFCYVLWKHPRRSSSLRFCLADRFVGQSQSWEIFSSSFVFPHWPTALPPYWAGWGRMVERKQLSLPAVHQLGLGPGSRRRAENHCPVIKATITTWGCGSPPSFLPRPPTPPPQVLEAVPSQRSLLQRGSHISSENQTHGWHFHIQYS